MTQKRSIPGWVPLIVILIVIIIAIVFVTFRWWSAGRNRKYNRDTEWQSLYRPPLPGWAVHNTSWPACCCICSTSDYYLDSGRNCCHNRDSRPGEWLHGCPEAEDVHCYPPEAGNRREPGPSGNCDNPERWDCCARYLDRYRDPVADTGIPAPALPAATVLQLLPWMHLCSSRRLSILQIILRSNCSGTDSKA